MDDDDECQLCEQEAQLEPGTFTPHEHAAPARRFIVGEDMEADVDALLSSVTPKEGQRGSATDPPFDRIVQGLEALEEEARAVVRKLREEVDAWEQAHRDWWEVADCWGSCNTPEVVVAKLLIAAMQPELVEFMQTEPTKRQLARWLVQQPVAARVLRSVISWFFCQLTSKEQWNAKAREFLANLHAEVWEQLSDGGLARL